VLLKTERHAPALERLAPFTGHMSMVSGQPTAYLCSAGSCRQPVTNAEELRRMLEEETAAAL
jgi:uncharacterized protein YyaL (SSP411 family)